jgi:hypothetical protein
MSRSNVKAAADLSNFTIPVLISHKNRDQPSYLLFSPLIYLLTPSNAKSLQSVLFALQAPVLYDDELAKSKGVSKGFVKHMPRSDGVRGGSIIRNCESYA